MEVRGMGLLDRMKVEFGGMISPCLVPRHAGTREKIEILLVEDDEADAFLITEALRRNRRVGQIVRACDGVDALEMLDRGLCPDLAIVDLQMPRKDGLALLRDIRERRGIHFNAVVLTSSRRGADIYRSVKRGACMFATKPRYADKYQSVIDDAIASI